MKLEFSRHIFGESSNIKFHQNLPIGSLVVPSGQTDMTKLIVAFLNFANAPKKCNVCCKYLPYKDNTYDDGPCVELNTTRINHVGEWGV